MAAKAAKVKQISVRLEDELAAKIERAMSVFNKERPEIVSSALDHFFNLESYQQWDIISLYMHRKMPIDLLSRMSAEAARTRSRLRQPGVADAGRRLGEDVPFVRWNGQPTKQERFTRCIPLVPIAAAAGYFGKGQDAGGGRLEEAEDWIVPATQRPLRKGMFVMPVAGRSMEPLIPDGAYCLFQAVQDPLPLGRIVLAEVRDAGDSETGGSYTVKHLKAVRESSSKRRGARPRLVPENPAFEAFDFVEQGERATRVVAEMIEVLKLSALQGAPPGRLAPRPLRA